jgi:Xaa-Pro aminopeptidase
MTQQRLQRLREQFAAREIDALIVGKADNRRYLSGFTGSAGTLLITPDKAILYTDFRYTEQAALQAPHFEIVEPKGGNNLALIADALKAAGAKRVGFEGDWLVHDQFLRWQSALEGFDLVSVAGLVEKIRFIKDADELDFMRKAAEITDAGFAHILKFVRPGMRESEVALELEFFMRKQGADGLAFETIVASGARSAMPHGVASDKVIEVGDLVTFDFGARYKGYCSDMTRTIMVGQPNEKQREIYDIVLRAQLAGVAACKAGITGKELDAACRDLIRDAGYADAFGHSTGHGVGLYIHEGPRAAAGSDDVLEPGMIVTIEPGIYLPGFGGVRIEDMVLVTADGCERFSHSPKDLIILE